MPSVRLAAFILGAVIAAHPAVVCASDAAKALAERYVRAHVMPWIDDPVIVNAVKKANMAHAGLSQAEIDRMDRRWQAEIDAPEKPFIDSVLNNDVSRLLVEKQIASAGVITEIFVMDDKGLNVGQSDATSDFWQGDEDKFKKSYGAGPNGFFVDAVKRDESTGSYQSQVSFTLKDGNGSPIGAVTVGISHNRL